MPIIAASCSAAAHSQVNIHYVSANTTTNNIGKIKIRNYLSNVDRFMLNSDYVAKRVVKLFGCSVRELNLPFSLAALARLYQLCPTLGDWASIKFASKK